MHSIVRLMQNTQESKNTKIKCPARIRIGTRRSELAVAQAMEVKNRLLGAFPELTQNQIEIIKIQTTGDRIQDRHLAEIGGKGLFTKEIEEALFDSKVDIAVHSMKDMTDELPQGLVINCILEREDPRDAFISDKAKSIEELPKGASIGTSSIRRQSQVLKIRPDLKIVPMRGNVGTRIKKLEMGEADSTILAVAGLKRIDMVDRIASIIDTGVILPAVAQGAIGVECLAGNEHILEILKHINHDDSNICITAEREFLKALGGSCTTPIAGLAELKNDKLFFRGLVASPDGSTVYRVEREGKPEDAGKIGADAGKEVITNAGKLLNVA